MNENPEKNTNTNKTNTKLRKTFILKKRQANIMENGFTRYPTYFPWVRG